MAHSMRQSYSLTCPECGQTFDAEVWLIVDTTEQPELLDQIRADTLHDIPCPRCGFDGHVHAPLLIHQPDKKRVLFSPILNSTQKENEDALLELLRILVGSFGGVLHSPPAYLTQPVSVVREFLGRMMDADDLNATRRQLLDEAEDGPALLFRFIAARSWAESKQILLDHPELLDEEIDTALVILAKVARDKRTDERPTFH